MKTENMKWEDEKFLKCNRRLQMKKHPEYWGSLYKDVASFEKKVDNKEATNKQLMGIANEFIWLGQYLMLRVEIREKTLENIKKRLKRNYQIRKAIKDSEVLNDRERKRLEKYIETKSI